MNILNLKEAVVKNRVKKACETLDMAKDAEAMANSAIGTIMGVYKASFKTFPIIEGAVKRHPDQAADIVIEALKITKSIEKIGGTLNKVFDAEKGLPKQLEDVISKPIENLDEDFQKKVAKNIGNIEKNATKLKVILTGNN